MNKNETAQTLLILQEIYNDKRVTDTTINAWHPILEDYTFEEVQLAIKMMSKEREYSSFPTPASLIKYIDIIRGSKDANELWSIACRAMGQASTYTKETFAELPEEVQSFFGDIGQLREYGRQDLSLNGIVRASFFKELPTIKSKLIAKEELKKLKAYADANLDEGHVASLKQLIGD